MCLCLCLFPYFSYPQTRDASGIWQKIASPTKRSAQSFCQIGTLLWKKRCLKMITWLVHAEHGRQWVLLLWPPEAVELIRAGVHIDISFFFVIGIVGAEAPQAGSMFEIHGLQTSLIKSSLDWSLIGVSASFRGGFMHHGVPRASYTWSIFYPSCKNETEVVFCQQGCLADLVGEVSNCQPEIPVTLFWGTVAFVLRLGVFYDFWLIFFAMKVYFQS